MSTSFLVLDHRGTRTFHTTGTEDGVNEIIDAVAKEEEMSFNDALDNYIDVYEINDDGTVNIQFQQD